MYVTIQEAVELLGVSKVTVHSYINKGLLKRAPEGKGIDLESIYKIREERKENEK